MTSKQIQELAKQISSMLSESNNKYKETEALIYNYTGYKETIVRNKQRIDNIIQNGAEEKAKSNKGEYVQGGIKEYGGLPEEEIRQIDHILEENSKLEKRVIRIENALIHIEDDEYQEIIALRYFKNKSIEEIATHLDVNEKTIARNRTRIINKLQTILFSEIIIGY